jgi:hypothetical protein
VAGKAWFTITTKEGAIRASAAQLEKSLGEKLYDLVDNKDGSVSAVRLKR